MIAMANTREELYRIGDTLIDHHAVIAGKTKLLLDAYESYKRSAVLLGYFSQLRDFNAEYRKLSSKVMIYRHELLEHHKPLLISSHIEMFKQLLVTPTNTEWFTQGVNKYKKVKNYSTFYYRRKILITLERTVDVGALKKLIDIIVTLDKYYDIYDETIGFFMQTSTSFDNLMRQYFPDCIHL
jgi:phosphatidylglycerophosphatase A